jgi:hypothetical protein
MTSRILLGKIFMILSLVPLGFLIYTLTNLKELKIPVTHPRVIVKLSSVLLLFLTGFLLNYIE